VNRNRPAVPGSQWQSVTSNRKQQNILEQLLHNTFCLTSHISEHGLRRQY